jgi:hypothetical protein
MRVVAPLVASWLMAAPALAAETHPFSVQDMLAMDRISDPRVSPDGTRVVFRVSVTDLVRARLRSGGSPRMAARPSW